jgi:hypothetical protein
MPIDRPDARMTRPPCALCSSHRTLTLFDKNIPCPACSAPERADDAPMVHCCPLCGERDSLSQDAPCGPCRGRQLAKDLLTPPASLWSLADICRDRSQQ